MSTIISFPNRKEKTTKDAIVRELKRIAFLIEYDETDPKVDYLFMTFKQGDTIIIGGAGTIPPEDSTELKEALKEFLHKKEKR